MLYAIALGSNLGNRCVNLQQACCLIEQQISLQAPIIRSTVYQSKPANCPPGSGDFLNAVVLLKSAEQVEAMLLRLQSIEQQLGRLPAPPNAPRPLDLDILLAGTRIIETPDLILPHPRLHLRPFVLLPLAEVAPSLIIPGLQANANQLLARLDKSSCQLMRADCTL